MSKNRNRKVSQFCTQNHWYKIADFKWRNDPWDDYGWNFSHGNLPNHKWRSYRSWKHNRKTKFRE